MSRYILEDSIGYLVRAATRALRARLQENIAAAGVDAKYDEWAVAVTLHHRGPLCQQQLAFTTMLDKVGITRLIDAMESRGLVLRAADDTDRRKKSIRLTNQGEDFYQRLLPIVERTLGQAQRGLRASDIATTKQTLRAIVGNLQLQPL